MELRAIPLLLATVSCTAAGQVLMKKGVTLAGTLSIAKVFATPQIAIGGLCYLAGFILWLNVLRVLDLSVAYPASSFVYVLVIFLSALFLGEPINAMKVIGMLCICAGVVCIGLA